jgi:acyl-CoA synthetase (AMP-forming)/AMP-acid ligase II
MSIIKGRRRRSLLAFGAATAGLASAFVPSVAQAASDPTSPRSDVQRKDGVRYVAEPVTAGSPAEAALPPCTDFRTFLAPGGVIHVPSTGAGSLNCVLGQGNTGAGVKQLQRTINYCYTPITMDADYGPQTAARPAPVTRPEPGDLAILQYTSGSTRTPRGVPVSHAHLAANLAEGDLVLCGREKDVVFAAGRNVYPSDVEAAVAEVPGVRWGGVAAFGVPAPDGDRLVVAVESTGAPPDAVRRAVLGAVRDEVGLTPAAVVILPPRRLPKTSSGKLRRAEVRRQYECGSSRWR